MMSGGTLRYDRHVSVIEDSRKVLQDFIAPELRAIDARLTSLEKRFEEAQGENKERFSYIERRFDKMEQQIERRFDQILTEIRSLKTVHDLELRMAKYEAMAGINQPSQPARSESEAA